MRLSDLEIAQAAQVEPIETIAARLGLAPGEWLPWGRNIAKVDPLLARGERHPEARYIDVTAITPTPLGEGKTTTTVGLTQGLGAIGRKGMCAIRQPSQGPTFGIKGGAAGGGYSQVLPMEDFNLHLTGDIHAITAAHNLIAAAIDNQMYHESRWSDSFFQKRGIQKVHIDPYEISWNRVLDLNDRSLRSVVTGLGALADGPLRQGGFDITVASELMAVLALARDLRDLRERIGRIVVALDRRGAPVTTEDLGVAGAATVLLRDALWPNLLQTLEGQPAFVHAGPFANIAHGNSSVMADRIALARGGFLVTESGFGADIGMEKFFDIKCRVSGIMPDAVVLVATIRALKMHGGGPAVTPGRPLPQEYCQENLDLLRSGLDNLRAHIRIAALFGVPLVVAVNAFDTDTEGELALVREAALREGAADAVVTRHHARGGEGAAALAEAVARAADAPRTTEPRHLYDLSLPLEEKLRTVATRVYGAKDIELSPLARRQIERYEEEGYGTMPVCIAKTHLSLSHDPALKNAPENFIFPVRELRPSAGAGFVYALAGDIRTMPGLPSVPAFRGVDIDVETGQITGLF
ncbi:formate--tetrahydrofolate ligase [Alkalispirochaeta sphaeroplastigenens]|uniref:Formate--tetrahydrofolate ligase n=1 Tax=Alkalispirochaeta sphaeroplastigenens TaxID=1187066 RepID=A0A2S4JI49_9SPIO|nr:formate--tetrahydrofolate ligase [Alkalispirochaeta sphaeroplastigenens]POQ99139.1 formate--tetrahydrofolate ligase [Alkalispirochaeta sphaeroplastigenens]